MKTSIDSFFEYTGEMYQSFVNLKTCFLESVHIGEHLRVSVKGYLKKE